MEEGSQPINVEFPVWRQLKQDGTQFRVEHSDRVKEPAKTLLSVVELFHVSEEAATLDGEVKRWWCRISPD